MPPRRAKQRDENEPEIIEAIFALGWYVERMEQPVDLLCRCWVCGAWELVEVKNLNGKSRRKGGNMLTDAQMDFADRARRFGPTNTPVFTVISSAALVELWHKDHEQRLHQSAVSHGPQLK